MLYNLVGILTTVNFDPWFLTPNFSSEYIKEVSTHKDGSEWGGGGLHFFDILMTDGKSSPPKNF